MRFTYWSLFCALLFFADAIYSMPTEEADADYDAVDDEPIDSNPDMYTDKQESDDKTLSKDDISNNEDSQSILSAGQLFKPMLHDAIILPCDTTNGDGVLMWKKDGNILTQGSIKITPSKNIEPLDNGSLKVVIESLSDGGTYTCELIISTSNIPMIDHIVEPLVPPQIVSLYTENNKTEYHVGDKARLTCNATGNPTPKVQWFKDRKSGESIKTGDSLILENLTHKDAGVYRCFADNKVNKPAHDSIEIKVDHKPIITIHKHRVNSDQEQDVQLKCIVKAQPTAQVNWQKDGFNVVNQLPHIHIKRNDDVKNEHILEFKKLEEKDFGVYTCVASNHLGTVQKNVSLVKTPVVVEYVNPKVYNKDIGLKWKVESHLPIYEHEIYYRKKGEEEWLISKPAVTGPDGKVYEVKETIKSVDPVTYETKMRSKNKHGWSDWSNVESFSSASTSNHNTQHKHHKKPKGNKETPVTLAPTTQTTPALEIEIPPENQEDDLRDSSFRASQTAGSSSIVSSVTVISIALLAMVKL